MRAGGGGGRATLPRLDRRVTQRPLIAGGLTWTPTLRIPHTCHTHVHYCLRPGAVRARARDCDRRLSVVLRYSARGNGGATMKRLSFDLVAAGVVFLAVIIVPLVVTTVLAQSPDSDSGKSGDVAPRDDCIIFPDGTEYCIPTAPVPTPPPTDPPPPTLHDCELDPFGCYTPPTRRTRRPPTHRPRPPTRRPRRPRPLRRLPSRPQRCGPRR